MAQVPTAPIAAVASLPLLQRIQSMQQMQLEIRELAGKPDVVESCVQKIQALGLVVVSEFGELVAAEERSESSQRLFSSLNTNIQASVQKLFEKAVAKQNESANLWQQQKSCAENETAYAIRAARKLDAESCVDHTKQLLAMGMRIAEAREQASQRQGTRPANANPNSASERDRRIKEYKEKAFANQHQVVELGAKLTELFQLVFQSNDFQTLQMRNARLQAINGLQEANASQLQQEMGMVATDTRKILWRMDALMTFYNECVESRWQLDTVYPVLIQFHDLLAKEHAISLESAPDAARIIALKASYEKLKVEMAKTPNYPETSEFYTIGDTQKRPATVDKKAPEFDQLKADIVKKQLQDIWIRAKGRADWFCSKILDLRIGYLSKLLAQQPENVEYKLMLQKDMEERLTFFLADIAALRSPPSSADVQNLLAKAEGIKQGLPFTNQADRFNLAIIQLRAKQAELHTAEFSAQFQAKLAALKQASEELKAQIAAERSPEKAKPVLSADEVAALEKKLKGIDKPETFEGQMKLLVDLNIALQHYLASPYTGGEKAWLTEDLKSCFYPEAQASTQVPALTKKLNQQYALSAIEFEKQRKALAAHPDWVQIRNDIAKPLNIISDAIKAKGFKPEAEAAQNNERLAYYSKYVTRYTLWWDSGHKEAPKQAASAASPASSTNSSPENSSAAGVPAATGSAPASPEKRTE